MTGHLATFHTVSATDPRPSASPTAPTTGPVRTSPSATIEARVSSTAVTTIMIGRNFQKGRPSSTEYMRLRALPKALT